MKKQLLYFLLMVCAITMGQESNAPNPLQEALQVFPVSPEAASLGKYGDIPVNLASGKINYTVPLYTIKVGGFEWPIYLSYNYGGLVTEQDHAMTGMGWDLMANGRVTKQVRGVDDDYGNQAYKANTIVPYLQGANHHLSLEQQDAKRLEIYNNVANKNYDAEQDKYSINVAGLDGSFVFDHTGALVFLNHKNYKVEKNNEKFKITNDQGINYYFDVYELGTYSFGAFSEPVNHILPISYLLTKIELPNHRGSIYFDYSAATSYGKKVVSESETRVNGTLTGSTLGHKHSSISQRTLQRIRFPNGEVRFNVSNSVDQGIAIQALNEVSIWNNDRQITKYGFTYDKPTKNRKTLSAITKSNGNSVLPWYQFEYHSYPDILPFDQNYKQQDFWGFYNGLNYSLLSDQGKEIKPAKTQMGALKKITYPTKGYSEISYEQNRIPNVIGSDPSANCSYSHNKSISRLIEIEGGVFDRIVDLEIQVPKHQIVKITGSLVLGQGSENDFIGTKTDVRISSTGSGCTLNNVNLHIYKDGETIACEPGVNCPDSFTENYQQLGYTTDGKIRIQGKITAPYGTSISLRYTVHYEERIDETVSYKYVGGIRVSSTKDCDGFGNCKTKNYKYIMEDGTHSGKLTGAPAVFEYITRHRQDHYIEIKTHKTAKSAFSIAGYQGSPVLYNRVEILEEDGNNGKTVNHYSIFYDGVTSFPFSIGVNNDWRKGRLLKSEIFKKQGNEFVLQQETINEYSDFYPYGISTNSSVKAYGLSVGQKEFHTSGNATFPSVSHDYGENHYIEYPKEYKLIKTIKRDYVNDQVLANETLYAYDTPYGQMKTQTTTDSNNQTLTTTYSYPYDQNSTVNNLLVTQNRITTPIVSQNKENATILNTKETKFNNWGNGIVLPEITKVGKGNKTPEPRLTYHKYDPQGNPLEVSQINGRHIMYVWGYNNTQPILKIENATYTGISSGVMSLINQLQAVSNTEDTETEEASMRTLFKNLREHTYFANAQITGYTYDPLIGVTSITDAKGHTMFYEYDVFNRLELIKNAEGKLVSENKYNYKN